MLALVCGIRMVRRGERQRGLTFAIAVSLLLLYLVIDVARDIAGGTWPYVGELGFVTWALIMSVQLAHNFRVQADALQKTLARVEAQADQLRSMLEALHALEQNMHAPLETLETGVATLTATRGGKTTSCAVPRTEYASSRARCRIRIVLRCSPGEFWP